MDEPILRMEHITKIYPNGVIANKDVDFSVQRGEIHALMGENGAGKSTLMKILFGVEQRDSGTITFQGQEVGHSSPAKMIKLGIGMVHQHFMLVDSLTVFENVVLGMEPKKGPFTDTRAAIQLIETLSAKYNLKLDPNAKVKDLSVGLKQKVEILKVLARGAQVLILDEPTAVLTPQETEELFQQLILLKDLGHTVIFISHKIREVRQICDRITVLRGGRLVGVIPVANSTEEGISRFMVGRDVVLRMDKTPARFGEDLLQVRNLTYINPEGRKQLDKVSFSVKAGQILGIAGVEGNGQNQLAESLFGFYGRVDGEILFEGRNLNGASIAAIRRAGVSFIPEDRMTFGVCRDATIWENLVSDRIDKPEFRKRGLLDNRKIRAVARDLIREFSILCRNDEQTVGMLSGGNIQKVLVAREFSAAPRLIIANQPTRGIDVGANEFIWKKLLDMRDRGHGILLISADLNEVMELSDSILVMHGGEIAAYFPDSRQVSEQELGLYMLGVKKQERSERGMAK